MIFLYLYGSFRSQLERYCKMDSRETLSFSSYQMAQSLLVGPIPGMLLAHGLSGLFLISLEATYQQRSRPEPSNVHVCMCIGMCLGEETHRFCSEKYKVREEKRNKKRKLKTGENWLVQEPQYLDLQFCLWINKLGYKAPAVTIRGWPRESVVHAWRIKCSFVLRMLSWASGSHCGKGLSGNQDHESARGWDNTMYVYVYVYVSFCVCSWCVYVCM